MNDQVMVCAMLSDAVYSCTVPDGLGIVGSERILDEVTDTCGMAYFTADTLYIAFQGSESRQDWLNDFKIIKAEHAGIRAHRGFAMCARAVIKRVKAIIAALPDHRIVLTGHSLGGAIAVLVAVALRPEALKVITFGQPRVSTRRELQLALYGEYIRVVNGSDVVARSPWLGYSHAGTLLYLTNTQRKIVDPGHLRMFWDRLPTVLQRATDHSMTQYLKELQACERS